MIVKTLGIIGGGVMGRGVAQLALQMGFSVYLFNRQQKTLELSQKLISRGLDKAVSKGKLATDQAEKASQNLFCVSDLEKAVISSDFIVENIPENLELKKDLFKTLDQISAETVVLATNTSSLSVTEIASVCQHPERVIGMHFFNPPIAMKLLEIVVSETTSEVTYQNTRQLGEDLGRTCIQVKDSPGFATSRLSVCLGLEAIRLLEEGVASIEDIDKAMEVGYRHPMGPLKLGDYVGLDVRLAVAENLYEKLQTSTFTPPKLLKEKVSQNHCGRKSGQGFYAW